MGNGLTWEGMMGDLQPKQPWPTNAKLTAYAMYDGNYTNEKAGEALCTSHAMTALPCKVASTARSWHFEGVRGRPAKIVCL